MNERSNERLAGSAFSEIVRSYGIDDLGELAKRVVEVDPTLTEEDVRSRIEKPEESGLGFVRSVVKALNLDERELVRLLFAYHIDEDPYEGDSSNRYQ